MVGKDEMNGRINPAMEPDDDLPIVEAQRKRSLKEGTPGRIASNPFRNEAEVREQLMGLGAGGAGISGGSTGLGHTAF